MNYLLLPNILSKGIKIHKKINKMLDNRKSFQYNFGIISCLTFQKNCPNFSCTSEALLIKI